ncbi:MAG: ABC transporter permease [Propionibacteriaceae bacterium]|jgi:ABC-2 type transport system permease protein|nr:ABC transporter permease [Propionibacteriaceae bacterium]
MTALIATAPHRPARGLRPYFIGLEIKRMLTNVAVLLFCFALPIAFYLFFGAAFGAAPAGDGNLNALVLAMMGIYGSIMTAASCAYSVQGERLGGWNRQLRLTPLRPLSYVAGKIVAALVGAFVSLVVLYLVGLALRQAHMPVSAWFATFAIAWFGAIGFAAFGLFVGLVMDRGTPAAVVVPVSLVCGFLSGMFQVPLQGQVWDIIRDIIPLGGLVQWSQTTFGPQVATSTWVMWVNTLGWTVVFIIMATWAFARDTRRV